MPVEYMDSSIALSRAPRTSASLGVWRSLVICSSDMNFGRRFSCLGVRMVIMGLLAVMLRRLQNLKKLRRVASLRAMVALE